MMSFQSQLDKLPDINEYKANLESLKKIDFANMVQELIGENVYERAIILPQVPVAFIEKEFNKGTFFRVRKNINPSKEDLTFSKTFGYPKPNFCTQNGRANLKGKSVFYCSDVAATAILESKPDQKDIIYLSVWQPLVNRDVKAITLCKKVRRLENGVLTETEFFKPLHSQISALGIDKTQQLNYLNNFIGEHFITEIEPYYFTSWFSDKILYGMKEIDCIHYQSCVTSAFSNFAFHTNFIDNDYLRLKSVIKFETELVGNRYLNYALMNIGDVVGDKVNWRQLSEIEKADIHSIIKKGEDVIQSNP